MEILAFPEATTPMRLRRQVVALHDAAWPSAHPTPVAPTHDPALLPLSLLLVDDGSVLAALDVLSKEIVHRGEAYAASGLATVVTDPLRRRRGHGLALVEAARDLIEQRGADLAIFTCDTPLAPFYERAGFETLAGTALVGGTREDPFPSDRFDKVTLARFFSARARAAAGDFVGARIELFPGPVDRLW